jgi:hypothetical protein
MSNVICPWRRGTQSRTTSMVSLRQVAGLLLAEPAAALRPRQRQQLVDRVGGADAGAADLAQRVLQVFGTGALALGQIGLHAQARPAGS